MANISPETRRANRRLWRAIWLFALILGLATLAGMYAYHYLSKH